MDPSYVICEIDIRERNSRELSALYSQLTQAPVISPIQWQLFCKNQSPYTRWYGVLHKENNALLGLATLIREKKYIHGGAWVGHLEDVVLDASLRGKGMGKRLVTFVVEQARKLHCYKVMMHCNDHYIGFYKGCGFSEEGLNGMRFSLYDPDKMSF